MNISVLDQNNAYYDGGVNKPWAFGWTCQQDVSATEVTSTGGTYAEKAPVRTVHAENLKDEK